MPIPITLLPGYVAIYGTGTAVSNTGIEQAGGSNLRYGSVYKVWDGGAAYIYGNDNVYFKEEDVFVRLVYASWPYTIIPARLVTKEEPLL
jgi:hypothetical protein